MPEPGTLIWAIAALISLNASFAPRVELELHTTQPNNTVLRDVIELSTSDLVELLSKGTYPKSNSTYCIETKSADNFEQVTEMPQDSHVFEVSSPHNEHSDISSPTKRARCSKTNNVSISQISFFSPPSPVPAHSSSIASSSFLTPPSTP